MGMNRLMNTTTTNINDSTGKTYQETRLNADGDLNRSELIARSSKGAPMIAIPSRAVKQEKRMKAMAPAT